MMEACKRKLGYTCRMCCGSSFCTGVCNRCRDTAPEDCITCHPELEELKNK